MSSPRAFRVYWDAGYQIHIHVNGDAGLEMVLDNLEANMRRNPRNDHRTVIVHFAVSTRDQVDRIVRLGAIVSANPYYPVALADQYGKSGLGTDRADPMARSGDVERAGVSYSFHSDMPMAPAQPLFLMHCGVNRTTMSGRVAAPNQRVKPPRRSQGSDARCRLFPATGKGRLAASLPASWLTSRSCQRIQSRAMLHASRDITVWGTVHEGRMMPVTSSRPRDATAFRPPTPFHHASISMSRESSRAAHKPSECHNHEYGCCACLVGKGIAEVVFQPKNHTETERK